MGIDAVSGSAVQAREREKLPGWRMVMFALGQLGWSLASYAPGNLLLYFYLPPDSGAAPIFPAFLFQGFVFWIFTIIGLATGISRLFDAFVDPVVAGLSDRSRFKIGKRRGFLIIGIVPFALLSVLVFLPPVAGVSVTNVVWLFVMVTLYYCFFSLYATPYAAWISELGRSPRERLFLSTIVSVTWAIGYGIGSQVYAIQGAFEHAGVNATSAFQMTLGAYSVIGFVLMLLPILFINERRWGRPETNSEPILQSLKAAFKNRDFRRFVLSDLCYWTALTMATSGLVYYVVVLLDQTKELTSFLLTIMFLVSFVCYVPVNLLARKAGKKRVLVVGFILFMLVYLILFFFGWYPFDAQTQGLVTVIILGIPIAIFSIVPNAILSDIAESDVVESGARRTGMIFGARTFMQKVGQTLGGLIFPSLLLLGQTHENSIGLRISTLVALAILGAGLLFFLTYREKRVLDVLRTREDLDAK